MKRKTQLRKVSPVKSLLLPTPQRHPAIGNAAENAVDAAEIVREIVAEDAWDADKVEAEADAIALPRRLWICPLSATF